MGRNRPWRGRVDGPRRTHEGRQGTSRTAFHGRPGGLGAAFNGTSRPMYPTKASQRHKPYKSNTYGYFDPSHLTSHGAAKRHGVTPRRWRYGCCDGSNVRNPLKCNACDTVTGLREGERGMAGCIRTRAPWRSNRACGRHARRRGRARVLARSRGEMHLGKGLAVLGLLSAVARAGGVC